MPRFVLLYHNCPPGYVRSSHWDVMLETGGELETWALAQLPRAWHVAHELTKLACPNCPPLSAGDTISTEHLAAHRLAYLDYEGPVSKGRGNVVRIAAGTYASELQHDGCMRIRFDEGPLSSVVTLQRAAPDENVAWLLTYCEA